jgi:GH15 family glucan-1,4-alpha-glucosidase
VSATRYPPIGDYGIVGDCHSAALVSREGSIDWCCLPRFDRASCFGRLLDWDRGGHCRIAPTAAVEEVRREYAEGTLVLETTFRTRGGEARLVDCFAMRRGGGERPRHQLLRFLEGMRGAVELAVEIAPRFDYGDVRPWLRHDGPRAWTALGGDDGLAITGDLDLERTDDEHTLVGRIAVRPGERARLSLAYVRPEAVELEPPESPDAEELDRRLEATLRWWRAWSRRSTASGPDAPAMLRSALVVKALTHAPTGAVTAAPTTSLPEAPGGSRNWDYRFSWIRDSTLSVRALAELGYEAEADGFRRFVARTSAGHAEDLQILYGVGGERRMPELELPHLEGWRGARPVRIGNAAAGQLQLDAPGSILNQTWRWCQRGNTPDDDHWRFLADLVELTIGCWRKPDLGIWEWRGRPRQFVHSKAMCWTAVDRGLRIADACARPAPVRRWRRARGEIRAAIERRGYRPRRGVFVQTLGGRDLDAALLLLPVSGFVDWDDERMVRTADAIREDLDDGGLLRRYRRDSLPGREGAFLACSFWLVECLARQGRAAEAREAYDRAYATANDLGLFAEEYDVRSDELLGNFPQGLTHLSHIAAAVALGQPEDNGPSESPQSPR